MTEKHTTCIWLTAALIGIASLAVAQDAPSKSADESTILQWIKDLGHDRFQIRNQATANLIKTGKKVVPFARTAATKQTLEISYRAVLILSELALSVDKDTADAAAAALLQLAELSDENHAKKFATPILLTLAQKKHDRAMADIKSGGGSFSYDGRQLELTVFWKGNDQLLAKLQHVQNIEEIGISSPLVTDQSLQQLAKLKSLRSVTIGFFKDRKITEAAVVKLQNSLPDTNVLYFRGGFLGVRHSSYFTRDGSVNRVGSEIIQVVVGSAAHQAGLQTGDVIIAVDDKAVGGGDSLLNLVAARKAGDKIIINVIRRGKKLQFDVTLGKRPTDK